MALCERLTSRDKEKVRENNESTTVVGPIYDSFLGLPSVYPPTHGNCTPWQVEEAKAWPFRTTSFSYPVHSFLYRCRCTRGSSGIEDGVKGEPRRERWCDQRRKDSRTEGCRSYEWLFQKLQFKTFFFCRAMPTALSFFSFFGLVGEYMRGHSKYCTKGLTPLRRSRVREWSQPQVQAQTHTNTTQKPSTRKKSFVLHLYFLHKYGSLGRCVHVLDELLYPKRKTILVFFLFFSFPDSGSDK